MGKRANVHVKFTKEDSLLQVMVRHGQNHIQQNPQESHDELHKGAWPLTAKQNPKQQSSPSYQKRNRGKFGSPLRANVSKAP